MAISSTSSKEEEQLWEACFIGDLGRVKELTREPSRLNLNYQDPDFKRSPFYRSCAAGHFEIVHHLSKLGGLDQNLANVNDATPFYLACQEGHTEIVRLLLQNPGTNVAQPKQNGMTPFAVACRKGFVEVVRMLSRDPRVDITRPRGDGTSPLVLACLEGRLEVVKLLAQDPRIDVNGWDKHGSSPFFASCEEGHLEIVRFLLSLPQLDVNLVRAGENSPLWIAARENHLEVIKAILASRVEVDFASRSPLVDTTAREQASIKGHREVEKLLLEYEQDPRKTRLRLQMKLGILDAFASEVFALMIFFSDELLTLQD